MMQAWDAESALRGVESLTAVGCFIAAAEALYRQACPEPPITTWEVMQSRHPLLSASRWAAVFHAFANDRSLALLHLARAVAALALLVVVGDAARGALAAFLAFGFLATAIRTPYGLDGADQMMMLSLVAAALGRWGSLPALQAALGFVALQASLSYLIAGIAKILSPDWRRGSALPGLLATEIYGCPWLARWLHRNPTCSRAACWLIIGWEILFVAGWFLPPGGLLVVLAVGVLFHAACAGLMHLNTFVWAFPASYPAIWWAHQQWATS